MSWGLAALDQIEHVGIGLGEKLEKAPKTSGIEMGKLMEERFTRGCFYHSIEPDHLAGLLEYL
jgi:hypothetical protein